VCGQSIIKKNKKNAGLAETVEKKGEGDKQRDAE